MMGVSVTPEGPQVRHLELDQSNANLAFNTWALTKGLITSETTVALPGSVYVPEASGSDYVRTRAAALHSHLVAQPHATYVFLSGATEAFEGVSLHEVRPREASHAPDFLPVCGARGRRGRGAASPACPRCCRGPLPSLSACPLQTSRSPTQQLLLAQQSHRCRRRRWRWRSPAARRPPGCWSP